MRNVRWARHRPRRSSQRSARALHRCRSGRGVLAWSAKGLVKAGGAATVEPGSDGDEGASARKSESDDEGGAGVVVAATGEAEAGGSLSAAEVWETLSECSLVVGMHADGATEGIVDFALRRGKPFAVVPCCVAYPSLAMTYPAFIKHLVAKAPDRIRTRVLPFEGKNVCVYSLPESPQCVECG